MNMLGSKTIEAERLILRATKEADLRILYDILSIPEVNRYYLTSRLGKTFEDDYPWQLKKLARADDSDVFQWCIIKKSDNKCIGQISVQEKEGYPINIRDIGWFISPTEQRKGYAFEAASNVLNYMFKEVEIEGIKTSCAVCNPASFLLMEKLGFERDGEVTHEQNYTFVDGPVECYSYKVMRESFFK